jgi:peptidyl-tRNA hydrolase, PTH1 family
MKLIVGLGNPGPQYETTRHNIGFLAIDRLADVFGARGPKKEQQGEIFEASINGEKALLIKPQTFMNNSGKCVAPIFNFFKCEPEDLIVLHDDLDLHTHALRIKTGGGAGGHNGLKSLDQHIGAANVGYHRIRMGIGRPNPAETQISTVDWVLQPFTDSELTGWDKVLEDVTGVVRLLVDGNALEAMNKFNGKARLAKLKGRD